ncbi:hypothetical protein JG687_00019685 [Phytophthora cactorum]|uniref:Uncharacterized protein n=1 Tax=Phytophthora cactorum TaxID=29920 RepID=A0A8T1TIQ0_9STRA|nr:hypothetical protein JG687_00019685 [Phytophthora cactorum]
MITLERTLSVGTARFKASWNFSLILKNSSQDTTGTSYGWRGAPTIDDVFHAIENNDIQSGKGEALTTIPLPDLFDKEKLALLKVAINEIYGEDEVTMLKQIAMKVNLASNSTGFVVKDEATYL